MFKLYFRLSVPLINIVCLFIIMTSHPLLSSIQNPRMKWTFVSLYIFPIILYLFLTTNSQYKLKYILPGSLVSGLMIFSVIDSVFFNALNSFLRFLILPIAQMLAVGIGLFLAYVINYIYTTFNKRKQTD